MAERNEIHNKFSGQAETSIQIGVNNGPISMTSSSSPSGLNETQAERLRDLAGAVRSASDRELEKWGLRDRDALPVRWHTAAEDLFDYWEKIQTDGTPESLAGQFTAIRKTYEAVESRRLVVLGRAGAGKTVLAHRLILDLLKNSPTGPVPVLFSLSDWNPATELRCWLAEHLARDFLFLDAQDPTTKTKLAEVFVQRGLILPVLDGFDEIPDGHHRAAIRQISTLDMPLIVTSRPDEYAHAAHEIKAVGGAAAIALEDLTLDDTSEYLRQSTGKSRSPAWDAVFKQLRTKPEEPASRNLTNVLTSPLMVTLTRTVYNDDSDRLPSELLDAARFPEVEDLENHLLAAYLDTVYTGPHSAQGPNWQPDQARRWLGYLAEHLVQRNTYDLTWWNLPSTLHPLLRILAAFTTAGPAVGLAAGFVITIGVGVGDENLRIFGLTLGLILGLPAGLALGLLNEAGFSRGRSEREPERLRLRLRRRGSAPRSSWISLEKAASEFAIGPAVWLAVFLTFALTAGFKDGPSGNFGNQIAASLVAYLALGAVFGLTNIVVSAFGDSHSSRDAIDPWQLLSNDRTVTLVRTEAVVLAFLLTFATIGIATGGLKSVNSDESVDMFAIGLGVGFIGGATPLVLSAWGNWLLFARLWLPLTRRLPWRPKRFLEDAYDRGILRTIGTVYQFRHARLRDHLADHYRS